MEISLGIAESHNGHDLVIEVSEYDSCGRSKVVTSAAVSIGQLAQYIKPYLNLPDPKP